MTTIKKSNTAENTANINAENTKNLANSSHKAM